MIGHMQLSSCKGSVNTRCKESHRTPPTSFWLLCSFLQHQPLCCLSEKIVSVHYSVTAGSLVMPSIVAAETSECPTSLCA